MFDYELFRERLKEYRKGLGLSKDKMSEKLNIGTENLSSLELGYSKPTTEILINVLNVTGYSLDDFISDKIKDRDNRAFYINTIKTNLGKLDKKQYDLAVEIQKILLGKEVSNE